MPEPELQPKWKIPGKVAIQCSIYGGGSRIILKRNLDHPERNLKGLSLKL